MIRDTSAQDKVIAKSVPIAQRYKWLFVTLVCAIAFSVVAAPKLISLYSSEMQVDARQLRFATVERGDLYRDVTVQGRIIAAISPTFYALADGTVSLNVKAGDVIQTGQVLAQIDSPALNNQLAQEQSVLESLELEIGRQQIDTKARVLALNQQLEMAKVDREAAEREMTRAELSHQDSLISQVEFEQVQVAMRKAELTASHAEQNRVLEKERLEFELQTRQKELSRQQLVVDDLTRRVAELTITAPFDGIIGNVTVQEQQAITRNTPLLTAVDMSAFEIEAQIPESYADELGIGLPVDVTIDGQQTSAVLAAISPEVIEGQVTGRIRFDDTPGGLRQNQRISAKIFIESKANVLKVKRGAFVEAGGGRIAWRVTDDTAQRVSIETGSWSTAEIEVLRGLNAGDRIIVSNTSQFNQHESIYLTQ